MSARVCGVDEAGRGPLAGRVCAAAVILDPMRPISGLADSKTLSEKRRIALAAHIREHALAYAIAWASVEEIDTLNILNATLLAMQRAVTLVLPRPTLVLVDGNRLPALDIAAQAIVGGDATVECISAASILAKTARDAELCALDVLHPAYGFARHKGYDTPQHRQALRTFGATVHHRRSFAPVRAVIIGQGESSPAHERPAHQLAR